MIADIWDKRVVLLISMYTGDVTDQIPPLPLVYLAHWHHYIGLYFQPIQEFYESYQPFPYDAQHFYLEI